MSLIHRCAELSCQLGYKEGTPANVVISQAEKDLGLDGSGLDLVQRCNNCCAALGITGSSSAEQPPIAPVAATKAAQVPMGVAVAGMMPAPVMPEPHAPVLQTFPPMPTALAAAAPSPLDALVGQRFESFDSDYPSSIVETFQFTREGDVYVTTGSSSGRNTFTRRGETLVHTRHGEAITATLQPNGELAWSHGYGSRIVGRAQGGQPPPNCYDGGQPSYGGIARPSAGAGQGYGQPPPNCYAPPGALGAGWLIQTKDTEGCWICCCFPFMWWSLYQKQATGPDSLDYSGCLIAPLLCPFVEHRQRVPGTNRFHKVGDPNNVDWHKSPSCVWNGPACAMRLC